MSAMTTSIAAPVINNNVKNTYKETSEYKKQYEQDVENVENQFKNDEINYEQLQEEMANLGTSEYIKNLAMHSQDPEIQSLVKFDKVFGLANCSILGSLGVLWVTGLSAHELVDRYYDDKER